ncbi:hypothetical protein P4O66_007319 [Electrophorus voltai]|uniref:C2H2-type domain-containing protein n=1 Tax=Electrophorus voltai TaxID=2609070 RepID=A0AAD8ZGM8_9TELE|nr:hypothetical protein P4O66_007319 [Electrophorus voltai]
MAAQTVFALGSGMFVPSRGIPLPDESHELPELPRTDLPAPQLVMLANVALTSEAAPGDCVVEEKQMVELKNVGCSSYSDSEDENVIRYSYDNSDSPESPYHEGDALTRAEPRPAVHIVERVEGSGEEMRAEDLSKPASPSPPVEHAGLGKRKHSQVVEATPAPTPAAEPPKKKKKPFYCKPCQYQAACEEEFIHHIRVHSAKKLIVVNGAGDSDDEAEPGGSTQQQGPENGACTKGVIRCERCGYNTNRYDHYMAHLRHHKNEGDDQRVFKCTICPYSTVSQYHWKKHLRNHFPSKLFTCNQCSYFSDRKNNYIQHIRTHTGERPFQCLYCDYSSSQKTHLTRHMRTHSGERPFKCDSCSYLAANQHEVTRHARQVHNGPKPLSCPYCQYKTADRSNFKKHVELHVNPRQFLCPVCKYAASKKCNLQYHIKSRHPGCSDISMDVSKVRLRVKKADGDEAAAPPGGKQAEATHEQQGESKTTAEEADSCSGPINLSIRKSGKPGSAHTTGTEPTRRTVDLPGREKASKASLHACEKKAEKRAGQKNEGRETSSRKVRGRVAEKSDPTERAAACCVDNPDGKRDKDPKKAEKTPKSMEKAARSRSKKERVAKANSEKDQPAAEVEQSVDLEGGQENSQPQKETRGVEQRRREEAEERRERGRPERENRPRVEKEDGERETEISRDAGPKKAPPRKQGKKPARAAKADPREEDSQTHGETCKEAKTKTAKRKVEDNASPQRGSTVQDGRSEKVRRKKEKVVERPSLSAAMAEPAAPVRTDGKVSKGKARQSRRSASKAEMSVGEPKIPSTSVESDAVGQMPNPLQGKVLPSSGPEQVPKTHTLQQDQVKTMPQCLEKSTAEKITLTQQQEESAPHTCPTEGTPTDQSLVEEGPQITETMQSTSVKLAEEEEEPGSTKEKDQCNGDSKDQETPEEDSGSEEIVSPTVSEREPGFIQEPPPKNTSLEFPEPTRPKPADGEDDEGIHSHDGGSDISDCASEGSYDSGLNGLPAATEKLPETPTEELPSPTQLLSHTCVFCDRTFPLEMDYRRHLHRHLVNVYYLETAMQRDK